MAKKSSSKHHTKKDKDLVDAIDQDLTKFEVFFEKYQNQILIGLGVILLIVILIWGYQKYIKIPREKEAMSQMFMAERYFAADSFKIALNGIDQYPGFLDIIDNYKGTKAANLAKYYAGVCYANLGDWQNAIDYLKRFKTKDKYLGSTQYGLMGDSYMQLGQTDEAIKAYKKSTEDFANHLTTPIYLKKLGLIYEKQNNYKKALEIYKKIYLEYPGSNEARTIEKYIERCKLHLAEK